MISPSVKCELPPLLKERMVLSKFLPYLNNSTENKFLVSDSLIASGMGFIPLRRLFKISSRKNTLIRASLIVGDVLYAAYKPNSRNAHLLEEFLITRAAEK